MPESDDGVAPAPSVLSAFRDAAIERAAGGRGQPLVDAAAEALACGLDSPSLRLLAGALRRTADEEASDFAPATFEELGLEIAPRCSVEAFVAGAKVKALHFLSEPDNPRHFAKDMWRAYVESNYAPELASVARALPTTTR